MNLDTHIAEHRNLSAMVDMVLKNAHAVKDIDTREGIYSIQGMSGKRYRYFINRLIGSLLTPRYLEVGVWVGSTLCSAIHGNRVSATAIDNWCYEWFGLVQANWERVFYANLSQFLTPGATVKIVKQDFRRVDYGALGPFDVYMFDGPHARQDQYDGLIYALPAMADQFVFIVDDWNWPDVREGTWDAISDAKLKVTHLNEIRTTQDNTQNPDNYGPESDWHNGYFISVLNKG